MKTPRVVERLASQGLVPVGSNSEDFAAFMITEIAKYGRIIKEANINLED